jgi:hypothetical protein
VERARPHDILNLLPAQIDVLHSILDPLDDAQACYRFGPGEWSIKELVGHLADVERIFSYRMLRISRNDATRLPGFSQDDYVKAAHLDAQPLGSLLQEFEFLRRANMLTIAGMSDEMVNRRGTASGLSVTVRALIYMLPGHVDHHLDSLKKNYLPAL